MLTLPRSVMLLLVFNSFVLVNSETCAEESYVCSDGQSKDDFDLIECDDVCTNGICCDFTEMVLAGFYSSECTDPNSWVDVDNDVICDDCTVLAGKMGQYRTCDNYCEAQGLICDGAWEEKGESCAVKSTHTCDFDFKEELSTSDALCRCIEDPSLKPGCTDPAAANYYHLATQDDGSCYYECTNPDSWLDVDGVVCDDCIVLADRMGEHRNCNNYCELQGLVCGGAWEEKGESCEVKSSHTCETDFKDELVTSDALCRCVYYTATTTPEPIPTDTIYYDDEFDWVAQGYDEDDIDMWNNMVMDDTLTSTFGPVEDYSVQAMQAYNVETYSVLDYSCESMECHYASKGWHESCGAGCGTCDTKLVGSHEELPVRCCSDDELPGWKAPKGHCTVYHESQWQEENKKTKCAKLNWNDASDYCESQGGRLCTVEEVEANCAAGDGCGYNDYMIWTSDEEATTTTVEPTTTVVGTGFHMAAPGGKKCGNSCHTQPISDTEQLPVRCCRESDTELPGWMAPKGQCTVYHESWDCQIMNWWDANEFCQCQGGRLCTVDEVQANCAAGDGCMYDHGLIWTSEEAEVEYDCQVGFCRDSVGGNGDENSWKWHGTVESSDACKEKCSLDDDCKTSKYHLRDKGCHTYSNVGIAYGNHNKHGECCMKKPFTFAPSSCKEVYIGYSNSNSKVINYDDHGYVCPTQVNKDGHLFSVTMNTDANTLTVTQDNGNDWKDFALKIECCAAEVWVDDGCHSDKKPDDFLGVYKATDDNFGVRCCAFDGSYCKTPKYNCGDDTLTAPTFSQAIAYCKKEGLRLCTKDELLSDICCGTGGSCDHHPVWTSSTPHNPSRRALQTKSTGKFERLLNQFGL